jgi:hypothetical protein
MNTRASGAAYAGNPFQAGILRSMTHACGTALGALRFALGCQQRMRKRRTTRLANCARRPIGTIGRWPSSSIAASAALQDLLGVRAELQAKHIDLYLYQQGNPSAQIIYLSFRRSHCTIQVPPHLLVPPRIGNYSPPPAYRAPVTPLFPTQPKPAR